MMNEAEKCIPKNEHDEKHCNNAICVDKADVARKCSHTEYVEPDKYRPKMKKMYVIRR